MVIKDIEITDFKSIYGTQKFDFTTLDGIIKLSGVVGAGKTTVGEAILWGLFGETKDLKQESLVAWHTKSCCIDMNLSSKGHDIFIHRDLRKPLEVYVDGKILSASNKRKTQEMLEIEFYDVPKMAIEKMCIVSFNAFNKSIAKLTPYETKQFLDEIFGFNVFTEYNDEIVIEKKNQVSENDRLNTVLEETNKQIIYLNRKKEQQQQELKNTIDINALNSEREQLIEDGKTIKLDKDKLENEYTSLDNSIMEKIMEATTLGKQEKEYYNTFKEGKCPTCGQPVNEADLQLHKDKMYEYANSVNTLKSERIELSNKYKPQIDDLSNKINSIKKRIQQIDQDIKIYKNNLSILNENYDQMIDDYNKQLEKIKYEINDSNKEIVEWNEMNELFSKTFRYNLLNSLIPHINNAIQFFINKFDLPFSIKFDEEFKSHIFVDGVIDEITYSNLSTGQKKQLDVAIIFGILQNIIANVNFNVFFLDELMSNMDTDTRNVILDIIKNNFSSDKTIFVINHAEMADDFFNHKIRVTLENKKIIEKKNEIVVKGSKYTQLF